MAKGFWGWIYPKTWLFGRPYTHIIRDAWKAEPTSFLFLFTAVGMLVGRFIPSEAFWWFLGALFVGVVLGHLFWPTTYGLGRKRKPQPPAAQPPHRHLGSGMPNRSRDAE